MHKNNVTRTNPKERVKGRKKNSTRFMAACLAAILTLSVPATALPAGASDGATIQDAESNVTAGGGNGAETDQASADESQASSKGQASEDGTQSSDAADTTELTSEKDNYEVTLSWDKTAVTNIPADAQVRITPLKETDEAYQSAREAVIREKKSADSSFNEDTLGMDAVDISIMNADGSREIEPNGKVNVKIQLKELPDGVDSDTALEVQHIVDTAADSVNENSISSLATPTKRLAKHAPATTSNKTVSGSSASGSDSEAASSGIDSTSKTAQTVLTGAKADQIMQFEVESFSIFTITWTTQNGARFANVKVHYVDENGLELSDPATVPASELNDGADDNIVDLSKWATDTTTSGESTTIKSKIDGYRFEKATIGTLKGTEITGLKGEQDPTTETQVPVFDNDGKATLETKNVKIYHLYYTSDKPVEKNSTWTQYKDPTSNTSSNNADVFMIYKKAAKVPLTIRYITKDGKAITDANGNALTKTVDASEWSDSDKEWQVIYGLGDSINGYTKDSGGHGLLVGKNGSTLTYPDHVLSRNSAPLASPTKYETISGIGFVYIGYKTIRGSTAFEDGSRVFEAGEGNVPGNGAAGNTNLDTKTVTNNSDNTNYANRAWSVKGDFDIYLPYTPANNISITVHHVDSNGKKIADDTAVTESNGNTLTIENAKRTDIRGYRADKTYYGRTEDNAAGTEFSALTYNKGTNSWTSTNAETDTPNLVTEVWVVYKEGISTSVNIHHINEQGVAIHETTTKQIESGDSLSVANAAEPIDNYTGSEIYFKNGDVTTPFSSLTFTYEGSGTTGTWSSSYKTSSDETATGISTGTVVTDVYVVYQENGLKNLTIHHVDTEGIPIASNATYNAGGNNPTKTYANWNGFSNFFTGSNAMLSGKNEAYIKSYIGYFGDELYSNTDANNTRYTSLSYQCDENHKWHTAVGTGATTPTKEFHPKNDNTAPILLTDIYQVYGETKGIKIHHVDESGKTIALDTYKTVASGNTIKYTDMVNDTLNGYALDSAHLNSHAGTNFTSLSYTYDGTNKNWKTSYVSGTDNPISSDNVINEVWLVYKKGGATKTFTAHYVYQDGNGDIKKTNTPDATFSISTDTSKQTGTGLGEGGNPQYAVMGDGENTASNKDFFGTVDEPKNVTSQDGNVNLSYVTTRIGSETGPELSWIKLDTNGQILYLSGNSPTDTGNASTTYQLSRQGGRNIWTHASNTRTFTLTRNGENFSLNDSLNGSFDLNMTYQVDGDTPTYTATYRGDGQVTQYSVKQNTVGAEASTNYTLTVEDWVPSTGTDIYFIYKDASKEIYIDNDLIYSGRLKVAYSDDVEKRRLEENKEQPNAIRNATYTWYKITAGTDATVDSVKSELASGAITGTEVLRTQYGTTWNMAYDLNARTWLDVAADNGERTTNEKVFYRVKMDYTNAAGVAQTPLWSDLVEIQYYGQLENGSFETPKGGNQYSNEYYKAHSGVWQTTGPGSLNPDNNRNGDDIEIVDASDKSQDAKYLQSYGWPKGAAPGAADGDQFAELNCEWAGALYQDVLTHPNEELSYGLSHRARGNDNVRPDANAAALCDTMYLIIMPTKIAMTAGDGGTELNTQSELENFIRNHGGYDERAFNPVGTPEENTVTYRNMDTGVLIVKITSDNQDWHTISALNGYVAKSELTRFFFVAGPTAYHGNNNPARDKTVGNMLDAVWFTQEPSVPAGFDLTVTKTFNGLTSAQIASMASNAKNVSGADISNGKNDPFTITISNKHVDSTTGREDDNTPNAALNGAILQFTASGSGGSYNFTPTATSANRTDSLFSGESSGTSRVNADGSVTMTWYFRDQAIDGSSADQQFNYTAEETGETISGLSVNSTKTVTPSDTQNKEAVAITPHAQGTIAFTNNYNAHRSSDQPEITVKKTFSGVTPETVNALWSGGYKISVKNGNGITADLSIYSDQISANASLVSSAENQDGSITYTWVISGENWGEGSYTVSEENLAAGNNNLEKVTVNGENVSVPSGASKVTKENVAVSDSPTAEVLLSNDASVKRENSITDKQEYAIPSLTNVIIAQYVSGNDPAGTANKRYVVWTERPLGVKTSNAIVSKINTLFGDNTSMQNVSFRSGTNPGAITINDGPLMTYDSGTRRLTFENIENHETEANARTWTRFYSTHYSVLGSGLEAYDDQDIQIANVYSPTVKIKKVSDDDNKALKGAEFRLYKKNADDSKQYYLATSTEKAATFGTVINVNQNTVAQRVTSDSSSTGDNGDNNDTTASEAKALSFTTDSAGQIKIGTFPVPSDEEHAITYYLEEVKAPDGYNRTIDIPFTVHADGTIQLVKFEADGSGSGANNPTYVSSTDNAQISRDGAYYAITVKDKAGFRLPETGGPGRNIVFWLLGFAIAAAAIVYLSRKGYFKNLKKFLPILNGKRGGQKV